MMLMKKQTNQYEELNMDILKYQIDRKVNRILSLLSRKVKKNSHSNAQTQTRAFQFQGNFSEHCAKDDLDISGFSVVVENNEMKNAKIGKSYTSYTQRSYVDSNKSENIQGQAEEEDVPTLKKCGVDYSKKLRSRNTSSIKLEQTNQQFQQILKARAKAQERRKMVHNAPVSQKQIEKFQEQIKEASTKNRKQVKENYQVRANLLRRIQESLRLGQSMLI